MTKLVQEIQLPDGSFMHPLVGGLADEYGVSTTETSEATALPHERTGIARQALGGLALEGNDPRRFDADWASPDSVVDRLAQQRLEAMGSLSLHSADAEPKPNFLFPAQRSAID